MLALKKGLRYRLITGLLILFNVITFSYFSLKEHDQQIALVTKEAKSRELLISEKNMIVSSLASTVAGREELQKRYNSSYDKNFITRANKTLLPQIQVKDKAIKELQDKLEKINNKIMQIKNSGTISTILFGTIAIIVIKLLLQVVSLILIADLRTLLKTNDEDGSSSSFNSIN